MGNVGPNPKEGLTELIATGGVCDYSKGLVATMPEVREAARKLREGSISNEEFVAVVKRNQAQMQNFVGENGKMIPNCSGDWYHSLQCILDLRKGR